jgi:DNA-binding XRE family transcriptional regulator
MKIHPQIISQKGQPAFVVLPYKEYKTILESLEDIEDVEAVKEAELDKSERFPLTVVEDIASGNPIKVLRKYRKISQAELANRINVSRQYISQIESGERTGTAKILKKIALILNVNLDDLA